MSKIEVAKEQVRRVEVSSWDQALDAIDGRELTLDGIHGMIRVDRSRPHDTRIMHVKSARGRRTEAYQRVKRELRDDWDSDLTQDPETSCAIAEALGVVFVPVQRAAS